MCCRLTSSSSIAHIFDASCGLGIQSSGLHGAFIFAGLMQLVGNNLASYFAFMCYRLAELQVSPAVLVLETPD